MLDIAKKPDCHPDEIKERRSHKDRRKNRFSSLFWFRPERRRRRVRRRTDKRRLYLLDYYKPILFYWVMLVLVLSLLDATLTLWLLSNGAEEINPVMDHILKYGPTAFVVTKYLFTALSLLIIVLLNYLWIQRLGFSMYRLLYCFAGIFGAVVLWQLYLVRTCTF